MSDLFLNLYPVGCCVKLLISGRPRYAVIEQYSGNHGTSNAPHVLVNFFAAFDSTQLINTKICLRGVCIECDELVLTEDTLWVPAERVVSIIFVFTKQAITTNGLMLQGMHHSFLIRYNSQGTPLPDHKVFSPDIGGPTTGRNSVSLSYSQRMWYQLEEVRALLLKKLSWQSKLQVWRAFEWITLSTEFASFLKSHIVDLRGHSWLEDMSHFSTYH